MKGLAKILHAAKKKVQIILTIKNYTICNI